MDGQHQPEDTPAPQAPSAAPGYQQPVTDPAAYGTPTFPAATSGAPAYSAGWGNATVDRASYGSRILAYLVDVFACGLPALFGIVIMIATTAATVTVNSFGQAVSKSGPVPGLLATLLIMVSFGLTMWNFIVRQGRTGQTIGKKKLGIALVSVENGAPIGTGMCALRWFVPGILSAMSCCLFGLLDYLWPLWDQNGQRLADKMAHSQVRRA